MEIKNEKFDKEIDELKESLALQKKLIEQSACTLFGLYHFSDGTFHMEGKEQKGLFMQFSPVFESYPFKIKDLVLPKDVDRATSFFDIQNKNELYEVMELRLRIDRVHYQWFRVSVMIQCDETGERTLAAFMFMDIESEVEANERLVFLSKNDMLTHIPNMRTFADDVRTMIDENPDEHFAMITIDIYQFHVMNKLYGHHEADRVLKYLATKLQEIVEAFDKGVYCRNASDVFYVCMSEEDRVHNVCNMLQEEMTHYPLKYELKLCFGIYRIEDRDESVGDMIEHSIYARVAVKKNPHHLIMEYDDSLKEKEYFETLVVSEMEQALKDGQFEIFYQPKGNADTKEMIGSEALIRWKNPELGYISPGIFIPIFESNGLVTELDYYVYESVCRTLRQWLDEGMNPLPVSVNVSRCDLYDMELIPRILDIVNKYRIPHHLIEFEITESAFILEKTLLQNFSREMYANGFNRLIDDFGSGYSCLNMLKSIEADILKIDIAFLPISTDDWKSPVILEEMINMAKKLNFDIIAEGVETKEQLELLKELGCDKIQGYYLYRPMPEKEYKELLIEQYN